LRGPKYPVRPFPVTKFSQAFHVGGNCKPAPSSGRKHNPPGAPRSIKLTKTMGFPGQNQWKEHDRACIAYARESFKFMPFVLQVTNLLRCGWKYIIAVFFGDSISGEVQSLLRVLEKPTVTALSHLFAGLKLPTMEKKIHKN